MGVAGGSGLFGEAWGATEPRSPCGPILEGIPTILVGPDAKWAAMATAHVACDQHGDDVQIAEVSTTVLLGPGRLMATRIGDKGTCGFVIGEGCRTVIIDGPTGTAAELEAGGEVPAVINYALTALTLAPAVLEVATAGSVALGVLALGRIGEGLLGGVAGAEVLGDVGEHFFGKRGKAVGQLAGGLLGGYGASKGAGRLLPDRLAVPLEGLFRGGRGVASVPEGEGAGGAATGGTAGQPAEPAPTFQPHTPESLARGQAAADAFRDGIRRGDDLPGRGPWGPAQALLDAILGRGPRPAFAGARAGGGARGGRPLFDEGGGVFSPKKGGNVLEARAAGTGGQAEAGCLHQPIRAGGSSLLTLTLQPLPITRSRHARFNKR